MNYIFGNKKPEQHKDHYILTLKDEEPIGFFENLSNTDKNIYYILYNQMLFTPDDKPIHLFIETHGGEAFYVDKICRLMNKRQHPVRAIVQKYAHSAGTVIALAAKELYIEEKATLSSIDVQTQFPQSRMGVKDIAFIFNKNLDTTLNNIGVYYTKMNDYYLDKMRTWIHPRHDVEKIIQRMYTDVSCHGELFYPEDLVKIGVNLNDLKINEIRLQKAETRSNTGLILGTLAIVSCVGFIIYNKM